MEVTLQCRTTQEGGPAVPVEIKTIKLVRYFNEKEWQVPTPEVTPGSQANEFTYTLKYQPRQEDWGDMSLSVDFVVPAEKEKFTHTLKTHFFSSPVAPAQFRGVAGERIDNGSLIITVEVNARFAGRYTIEANLFNDEGPVAIARRPVRKTWICNFSVRSFTIRTRRARTNWSACVDSRTPRRWIRKI